jgi:cystathionine beta-lyase
MGKARDAKPATRLAGAGRRAQWTHMPDAPGGTVNPPVWRGSTHLYDSSADLAAGRPNEDGHFYYGRRGSPTQWALAEALTEMEPEAAGTQLYPSGVAAIAGALLSVLRSGDELLVTDNCYLPTRMIADGLLKDHGVTTHYFDPRDPDAFEGLFTARTRAVFLESPGSLTMELSDVPALTAITRARGAVSLIDNTWATSLGFPALAHGGDFAIMSLTKHVGGHSDLMMGSVSATAEHYPRLRRMSQQLGQIVSPDDAALALRGLRTMQVRLERETASALAIAEWLAARPEVARVLCPMLPASEDYSLWRRDFTGGCGLFSFVFKGGDEAARARFIDALCLFGIGYSFGGFESLVIPLDPAGRQVTQWPPAGRDAGDRFGIRLSIGLEDAGDLIADLAAGFAAMGQG